MAMAVVRVLLCVLIVAMDVAAGILAIQAQAAQDKTIKQERSGNYSACAQSPGGCSSRAFLLGLVAAVLLALAHIMSGLLGGCTCVCSMEELERSSYNRKFWFGCLISSWIVAATGLPMLIIGMLQNSKPGSDDKGRCCRISPQQQHFLLFGGALCFAHVLLSFSFYCSSIVRFRKHTTADPALEDAR